MESVIIALMSIISSHFADNQEILLTISNTYAKSMMSEDLFIRGFSCVRLIDLLALRQRSVMKAKFISSNDYEKDNSGILAGEKEKYCSINVREEILNKYGIDTKVTKVYVDKSIFGYFSIPPFIRYYGK